MRVATINIKSICNSYNRFEGEHYLNIDSFISLALENNIDKCIPLGNIAYVFNPPVFKRQFCNNTPRAVKYYQSSDVQLASEDSDVYIFKGQAEDLNLLVKKNDILVTGFGTIGNVRIVSKHQDNTCYANNVCRIRVNEEGNNGYVYAFLASKYGKAQLNKNASGSVVRYIEAPGIKRTLIPVFSDVFQMKISNIIQESVRLREEATLDLEAAKKEIEQLVPSIHFNKSGSIKSSELFSSLGIRFEACFYQSIGKEIDSYIRSQFKWKELSEFAIVGRPDLFKRIYVKDGYMFLGGKDIFLSTPKSDKFVSKTKTPDIPSLIIKEGEILMPRSGTIGDVVFATSQHVNKLASEDVIRISSNNDLLSGYLYAFLSSTIGKALIQRYIFGSVIQHVEPHQLNHIPVPVISDEKMNKISSLAISNKEKLGKASELELKAISMVEQEIEKWN